MGTDAKKCLEDNNQTKFLELYNCKDELFEPASGSKSDDDGLQDTKFARNECFLLNAKSKENEKEKIQKLIFYLGYFVSASMQSTRTECRVRTACRKKRSFRTT